MREKPPTIIPESRPTPANSKSRPACTSTIRSARSAPHEPSVRPKAAVDPRPGGAPCGRGIPPAAGTTSSAEPARFYKRRRRNAAAMYSNRERRDRTAGRPIFRWYAAGRRPVRNSGYRSRGTRSPGRPCLPRRHRLRSSRARGKYPDAGAGLSPRRSGAELFAPASPPTQRPNPEHRIPWGPATHIRKSEPYLFSGRPKDQFDKMQRNIRLRRRCSSAGLQHFRQDTRIETRGECEFVRFRNIPGIPVTSRPSSWLALPSPLRWRHRSPRPFRCRWRCCPAPHQSRRRSRCQGYPHGHMICFFLFRCLIRLIGHCLIIPPRIFLPQQPTEQPAVFGGRAAGVHYLHPPIIISLWRAVFPLDDRYRPGRPEPV